MEKRASNGLISSSSTFTQAASISLTAMTEDSDGSVGHVEFYTDAYLPGAVIGCNIVPV